MLHDTATNLKKSWKGEIEAIKVDKISQILLNKIFSSFSAYFLGSLFLPSPFPSFYYLFSFTLLCFMEIISSIHFFLAFASFGRRVNTKKSRVIWTICYLFSLLEPTRSKGWRLKRCGLVFTRVLPQFTELVDHFFFSKTRVSIPLELTCKENARIFYRFCLHLNFFSLFSGMEKHFSLFSEFQRHSRKH